MFAKLFAQIFDSSIAEDYNCRRMFMDLLVLADPDGVVDMTQEAIARRTNVPIEQVIRYIAELQQPDPASRSKAEQGRRLIPVDEGRGWGWQIVNYHHYRKIRDEEARRSYFRDAKRKQRKRNTKNVKDKKVDTGGRCQIVSSSSTSSSVLRRGNGGGKPTQKEVEEFCIKIGLQRADGEWVFNKWEGNGWKNDGKPIKSWQATIRTWKPLGIFPSLKNAPGGPAGSKRALSFAEREKKIGKIRDERNAMFKSRVDATTGEKREFSPAEAAHYAALTVQLRELEA